MADNKKEYILRIVYNIKTDEIEHLSEYADLGYSLDIGDEVVVIPDEMGRFLEEEADSDILGIS
mgnify:CR=1 FL=1|tara:strand:- start:370 stop:561 length:192 start_codon:yes stop_codon:yes gene_type:complete